MSTVNFSIDRNKKLIVSTVNGIKPDLEGNVMLPTSSGDAGGRVDSIIAGPAIRVETHTMDFTPETPRVSVMYDGATLKLTDDGALSAKIPRMGWEPMFEECQTQLALDDYIAAIPKIMAGSYTVQLRYEYNNDIDLHLPTCVGIGPLIVKADNWGEHNQKNYFCAVTGPADNTFKLKVILEKIYAQSFMFVNCDVEMRDCHTWPSFWYANISPTPIYLKNASLKITTGCTFGTTILSDYAVTVNDCSKLTIGALAYTDFFQWEGGPKLVYGDGSGNDYRFPASYLPIYTPGTGFAQTSEGRDRAQIGDKFVLPKGFTT